MVNLNNFVLDCGKLKSTPEVINMKKPNYVYDFENEILNMNLCWNRKQSAGELYQNRVRRLPDSHCVREKDTYTQLCNEWNRNYENNEFLKKYLFQEKVFQCEYDSIAKYYNIIPFTPSVMINISPDWKDTKRKLSNNMKVAYLKSIVENYLKESDRYDYYSYVIENGETGDHIHCHIVAHINPNLHKSVSTHLAKGRHLVQLQKYARKIEGMGGIIKGVGVQKSFLRNELLVQDKLNYLIEDLKPEGHKNKSVIAPGRVDKVLITVK